MCRTKLKKQVGKTIRDLRQERGWSQMEVANRSKVSRSYIGKIESKMPPDMTIDVLAKLANAFKMTVSQLIKRASSNR